MPAARFGNAGWQPHAMAVAIAIALLAAGSAAGGGGKQPPGKQPPTNTSSPTINGNAAVGATLTGGTGSWSRASSFAYRWLRCDTSGGGCASISGATAASYVVASGDAGSTLRLTVTASNQTGSTSATSAATSVVQAAAAGPTPAAPSNTTPPSIGGTTQVGATLNGSSGSWGGDSPMSFAYQWQTCDSSGGSCTAISGATATSYSLSTTDVGHAVRLQVKATNDVGQTSASSAPSTVVQSTAPAPTPQPSFPIRASFYYPWYPETWTVNNAHVFYHPTLGYYSTTDVATQQAHIRAMEYAGMNAAISSWWGPGHYTDTRLKQLMATTVSMGSPL